MLWEIHLTARELLDRLGTADTIGRCDIETDAVLEQAEASAGEEDFEPPGWWFSRGVSIAP
jgi:hypothetical protein